MIGIEIKQKIGIGDGLQFSSLPENYFRATGEMLVDVNRPWFFDSNPFVIRDDKVKLEKTLQMWNFSPKQYDWPLPRAENEPQVYLSNAEIWASLFGVKAELTRPRLYRFEDFPFHERKMILFQTEGMSHGKMPQYIIQHVLDKYRATGNLYHLAAPGTEEDIGLPKIMPATLWDLAQVISQAAMIIGLDSGPSWIASCYPDVISKKVRTKPSLEVLDGWIPLEIANVHSHWDDRCHQIFNVSDRDIGFTWSYRKI